MIEQLQQLKRPAVFIPLILLVIFLVLTVTLVNAAQTPAGSPGHSYLNFFRRITGTQTMTTSALDGLAYPADVANRHALGVMIENHPDARPQFGLADASIVYEAQAEGGITRFLAIYGPKAPEKVGPVRSARTYYLDWCLEYDCFYAHVGGNIDVLDEIPSLDVKNLDQFSLGTKAYHREPRKRIATEHTMFAEPAKLYGVAQKNQWVMAGGYPPVQFKSEESADKRGNAQTIDIEISSRQFNTSWAYNPTTNTYARSMAGQPHIDGASGQPLSSKVLIVQEITSESTLTRINEHGLKMATVGTGKAKIFQDGQVIDGSWQKASQKSPTVFLDPTGNRIKYNPGQRWVTIVTPGSKVTVTPATTAQ